VPSASDQARFSPKRLADKIQILLNSFAGFRREPTNLHSRAYGFNTVTHRLPVELHSRSQFIFGDHCSVGGPGSLSKMNHKLL
jgi:hypothetical protein